MSYLPSLPNATLLDVVRTFPRTGRPLGSFQEALLRGPSPLTVAERELITTFVSGLNACNFCHGVHAAVAGAFRADEDVLANMISDLDGCSVDEKLKPLLRYVRKLTETPAKMTAADAQAVYAAGWDETALHDAVAVCGLFNMMNRIVEGLGIDADDAYFRLASGRLVTGGYAGAIDSVPE